jgi:hypothetical protein
MFFRSRIPAPQNSHAPARGGPSAEAVPSAWALLSDVAPRYSTALPTSLVDHQAPMRDAPRSRYALAYIAWSTAVDPVKMRACRMHAVRSTAAWACGVRRLRDGRRRRTRGTCICLRRVGIAADSPSSALRMLSTVKHTSHHSASMRNASASCHALVEAKNKVRRPARPDHICINDRMHSHPTMRRGSTRPSTISALRRTDSSNAVPCLPPTSFHRSTLVFPSHRSPSPPCSLDLLHYVCPLVTRLRSRS